jgi:DNA-directed RNA polymerase subunit RPC12/RpoP
MARCKDCKKDVFVDDKDWYMVTADVWNTYGLGGSVDLGDGRWQNVDPKKPSGYLCMTCMEERLGRKIQKEDLLDCPLNTTFNYYTKSILGS